jgi:hypothetical protein
LSSHPFECVKGKKQYTISLITRSGEFHYAVDLPHVIRVAAHAALMVIDKYYSLTDECKVY